MQLPKSLAFTLLASLAILASLAAAYPQPVMSKRTDLINPDYPHLSQDQQCTYLYEFSSIYHFNVVVNNAAPFTEGGCGHGLIANLHGHGCWVTNWGCNYDGYTMNANFQNDIGCGPSAVQGAIAKAFGGLSVPCQNYPLY